MSPTCSDVLMTLLTRYKTVSALICLFVILRVCMSELSSSAVIFEWRRERCGLVDVVGLVRSDRPLFREVMCRRTQHHPSGARPTFAYRNPVRCVAWKSPPRMCSWRGVCHVGALDLRLRVDRGLQVPSSATLRE